METIRNTQRFQHTFLLVIIILAIGITIYFTGGYGGDKSIEIKKNRIMFDTVIRIKLVGKSDDNFASIYEIIWDKLSEIENSLDRYNIDGQLYSLNYIDSSMFVDKHLAELINEGLRAYEYTGGIFDIRCGELIDIWDFAGEGRIPEQIEIDSALFRMQIPFEFSQDTIFKNSVFPIIDVGGMAKGYAIDRISSILDTIQNIEEYIIDLGGNIAVKSNDKEQFKIGIQHPREPNRVAAKFEMQSGKCCATAGDYQRYFEFKGKRYHHIINLKTGYPARKSVSVTVIAPSGLEADILSTAFFIMGAKTSLKYLKQHPEAHAIFLNSKGEAISGNINLN